MSKWIWCECLNPHCRNITVFPLETNVHELTGFYYTYDLFCEKCYTLAFFRQEEGTKAEMEEQLLRSLRAKY